MNADEQRFRELVHAYADLETRVREMVSALCGSACGVCTSRCCTPDICEETLASAFLTFLRSVCCPGVVFTDQFGWQGVGGCELRVGRPPVCYEFYCREILECFPRPYERYLMRVLGSLIAYVGKDAAGCVSLVAIRTREALRTVDAAQVLERIGHACAALGAVQDYMECGVMNDAAGPVLERILTREDAWQVEDDQGLNPCP